jgi:hypothetical protein
MPTQRDAEIGQHDSHQSRAGWKPLLIVGWQTQISTHGVNNHAGTAH